MKVRHSGAAVFVPLTQVTVVASAATQLPVNQVTYNFLSVIKKNM